MNPTTTLTPSTLKKGSIALAMFVMATVGALGVSSTAMAQQRHHRPQQQRPSAQTNIDITFQSLEVTRVGDGWAVDYVIDNNSWNSIQRAGISANLFLYSPDARQSSYQFRHSSSVRTQRGRVIYPSNVDLEDANSIEIALEGSGRGYRISRTTYDSQCSPRVRVGIDERHRRRGRGHGHGHGHGNDHHPRHDSGRAQIISACERNTRFRSDFDACLSRGLSLPSHEAPSIITACGSATRHGSGMSACLDNASRLRGDRAETVRACGEVTKFDSDLNACLNRASTYSYTASYVIRACGAQTNFSSDFNACMDHSAALPNRQAPATINACGAATRHSSGFKQCLQTSASLGSDRVEVIQACARSTNFDSDFNRCLVRMNRPTHHHHHHQTTIIREQRVEQVPVTRTRTRREVSHTRTR